MMGGGSIMRGYYQGRYRDNVLLATQAEVRWPLGGRFGIVGFAGLAEVQSGFGDMNFDDLEPSVGGGLRFRFNKAEKNLRATSASAPAAGVLAWKRLLGFRARA
jgi:hypothetical protein